MSTLKQVISEANQLSISDQVALLSHLVTSLRVVSPQLVAQLVAEKPKVVEPEIGLSRQELMERVNKLAGCLGLGYQGEAKTVEEMDSGVTEMFQREWSK